MRISDWSSDVCSPDLADRGTLGSRGATFRIRWDRAPPGYCHHQKCWIIDAGHPTELAFVGGINLNSRSMVEPGHAGAWQTHDAYAERSEEHTSELQSLMRNSYAVFCLKTKHPTH